MRSSAKKQLYIHIYIHFIGLLKFIPGNGIQWYREDGKGILGEYQNIRFFFNTICHGYGIAYAVVYAIAVPLSSHPLLPLSLSPPPLSFFLSSSLSLSLSLSILYTYHLFIFSPRFSLHTCPVSLLSVDTMARIHSLLNTSDFVSAHGG